MKMSIKLALGCLAAVLVVAAVAMWQELHPTRRGELATHNITVGKTTKAELDTALGQATAVSFDSGYEVWVYQDKTEASGLARLLPVINRTALFVPEHSMEIVVLFHPDGVVKKYRVRRLRG